jgi:hypothetical protein
MFIWDPPGDPANWNMYFQEKHAVIALDLHTREQDKTVLPSSFGYSNSYNLNLKVVSSEN